MSAFDRCPLLTGVRFIEVSNEADQISQVAGLWLTGAFGDGGWGLYSEMTDGLHSGGMYLVATLSIRISVDSDIYIHGL